MIDIYPKFSKLQIGHRQIIQDFTSDYEPYSDFNFLSMFSWNIDGTTEISLLNDNLVIKLPDYLDGTPVISILGKNKLDESIRKLLKSEASLKLVPRTVISKLTDSEQFEIVEDEDNHDYIYDLKDQATLAGGKFSSKRKKKNQFMNTYGEEISVREFSLQDEKKDKELIDVFHEWAEERKKDGEEIENEKKAIMNLLENGHYFDISCFEIAIRGRIVGFSINEILPGGFANCHFQKSLLNFGGIDIFFTNFIAQELLKKGCLYVNWEQDLGIEGLRILKQSYKPVKMLKKYQIL